MDLKSYSRWYDYSRARDAMFAATDTAWAPWYIAHTDDKKRGRLNIISHLLSQVPYEPLALPRHHAAQAAAGQAATWSRTCRCGTSRHRSRQPSEAEEEPAATGAGGSRMPDRTSKPPVTTVTYERNLAAMSSAQAVG